MSASYIVRYKKYLWSVMILGFLVQTWEASAQRFITIGEAVREGLENNPTLRTESYNKGIVSASVLAAGLRPNPIFNNQTIQLINSVSGPDHAWLRGSSRQVWFQVTKPLQLGNIRPKKIDFAKQQLTSTNYRYNEFARNISYDIAIKWMNVWLLKTNLIILSEAKDDVDSLVVANELRLENNIIKPLEHLRIELLSHQYNLQIKALRNDYQNELRALKYLIGEKDSIDVKDDIQLVFFKFVENVDSLMSIAKNKRSDLILAKSEIDLNKKNIIIQRAKAAPFFEGGFIYNPQNTIQYAGTFLTMHIPVFDRNQGGKAMAIQVLKQSESNLFDTEQKIIMEVKNARNAYLIHRNNFDEFQQVVELSAGVLNTVRKDYINGATSLIDFLEAETAHMEMLRLYKDAIFNYRKSYLEVLYTTGLIVGAE